MLWQICLILLVAFMFFYKRNREFNKVFAQVPTKLTWLPIVGHAHHFIGDSEVRAKLMQYVNKEAIYEYDGVTSLWLGNRFFVVIADPEAAEVVLKNCLEKDDMVKITRSLFGNGSLHAPVPIWRPRRKYLALHFGQNTLNSFVKVFSKQATILANLLKTAVGTNSFSLIDNVNKYTMDTICETVCGVEINSQCQPSQPVHVAFEKYSNLFAQRAVQPWFYSDNVYKWHWDYPQFTEKIAFLKDFVAKVVKLKRQNMNTQNCSSLKKEKNVTNDKSLLEHLIESGGDKGFSDLELQEEALVMMLAGTDTTSTALSFTVLLLAKHPDIQKKVYEEVKEVIQDFENIQASDLTQFKYLDAVIKETLRLYPPIVMLGRKVEKKITLPSGLILMPNTGVQVQIWGIHRNPKYWGPDANEFRPERFLEEPLKHPWAFMPFSNGPRNCLGAKYAMMSIKTALIHLLRRYQFFLPVELDETTKTDQELPVTLSMSLKHAGNYKLRIGLRN